MPPICSPKGEQPHSTQPPPPFLFWQLGAGAPCMVESAWALRCSCRVAVPVHMTARPDACGGSVFAVLTCVPASALCPLFMHTRARRHNDICDLLLTSSVGRMSDYLGSQIAEQESSRYGVLYTTCVPMSKMPSAGGERPRY